MWRPSTIRLSVATLAITIIGASGVGLAQATPTPTPISTPSSTGTLGPTPTSPSASTPTATETTPDPDPTPTTTTPSAPAKAGTIRVNRGEFITFHVDTKVSKGATVKVTFVPTSPAIVRHVDPGDTSSTVLFGPGVRTLICKAVITVSASGSKSVTATVLGKTTCKKQEAKPKPSPKPGKGHHGTRPGNPNKGGKSTHGKPRHDSNPPKARLGHNSGFGSHTGWGE